MTLAQFQGVSWIVTGLVMPIGVLLYSGPIVAVGADWSLPFLLFSAAADGYAVGCNVGATTGPGAYRLYRRYPAGP
jgi:hypothetical protein